MYGVDSYFSNLVKSYDLETQFKLAQKCLYVLSDKLTHITSIKANILAEPRFFTSLDSTTFDPSFIRNLTVNLSDLGYQQLTLLSNSLNTLVTIRHIDERSYIPFTLILASCNTLSRLSISLLDLTLLPTYLSLGPSNIDQSCILTALLIFISLSACRIQGRISSVFTSNIGTLFSKTDLSTRVSSLFNGLEIAKYFFSCITPYCVYYWHYDEDNLAVPDISSQKYEAIISDLSSCFTPLLEYSVDYQPYVKRTLLNLCPKLAVKEVLLNQPLPPFDIELSAFNNLRDSCFPLVYDVVQATSVYTKDPAFFINLLLEAVNNLELPAPDIDVSNIEEIPKYTQYFIQLIKYGYLASSPYEHITSICTEALNNYLTMVISTKLPTITDNVSSVLVAHSLQVPPQQILEISTYLAVKRYLLPLLIASYVPDFEPVISSVTSCIRSYSFSELNESAVRSTIIRLFYSPSALHIVNSLVNYLLKACLHRQIFIDAASTFTVQTNNR